jgi:hypothetical protein
MAGSSFQIITDIKATLKIGSDIDKDFDFDLPGLDPINDSGVLAFVCSTAPDVIKPPEGLKFHMTINDKPEVHHTVSQMEARTIHEVIKPGSLKSQGNKLHIHLIEGVGTLQIADLVIWYRTGKLAPLP